MSRIQCMYMRHRKDKVTHCAVLVVHSSSFFSADVLDFLHSFHLVLICDRERGRVNNSTSEPSGGRAGALPRGFWFSLLSDYVLQLSRSRLNPLSTMAGKWRTHELSARLSSFPLTRARPPPLPHSHPYRNENLSRHRQHTRRAKSDYYSSRVVTPQL